MEVIQVASNVLALITESQGQEIVAFYELKYAAPLTTELIEAIKRAKTKEPPGRDERKP